MLYGNVFMQKLKLIIGITCLISIFSSIFFSSPLMAYNFSATVFKFQTKLAQKGNANAQYKLGTMYETGTGVKANLNEALKWYQKSSIQNNKDAIRRITYIEIIKNGFNNKIHGVWLIALKNEANNRNGEAAFLLGYMYENAIGMKGSLLKAKKFLKIANDEGVSGAENELLSVKNTLMHINEEKDFKRKKALAKKIAIDKLAQQKFQLKRLEIENRVKARHLAEQKRSEKKLDKAPPVVVNISPQYKMIDKPQPQHKVTDKPKHIEKISDVPWYEKFKQQANDSD